MTKRATCLVGAAVAMTMMPACDEPRAGGEGSCECGEIGFREAQVNGIRLNGIRLNGIRLNGIRLNGIRLNGPEGPSEYVELKKINVKGTGSAEESWLDGSMLVVRKKDNTLLSGFDLDGAKLKFDVREAGSTASKMLKILDVEQLAPGSDVWLYDVMMQVNSGPWEPLCLDDAGEPTQAILVADVWDAASGDRLEALSGGMTFACRDAAIAKCIEWGYRPWAGGLRDFHQACTRLVRADYCGDGTPHTQAGTPVHVLDQVGVQGVDEAQAFVVEAEWGPGGAVCLNAANMRAGQQPLGCEIPACGAPFASGGLIQSGKIVTGP